MIDGPQFKTPVGGSGQLGNAAVVASLIISALLACALTLGVLMGAGTGQ